MTDSRQEPIKGFSKLTPEEKRQVAARYVKDPKRFLSTLDSFHHPLKQVQQLLESLAENTLTNYPLPYNVAPNFLVNGRIYLMPMVIEESSVVAAAASAAGFWAQRGGFRARVDEMIKTGQLHFLFRGDAGRLMAVRPALFAHLKQATQTLTARMAKRGGGMVSMELADLRHLIPDYFQLQVAFDTADAMGANFINSCLEAYSEAMKSFLQQQGFSSGDYESLMAILSNHNPQCLVEVEVCCETPALGEMGGVPPAEFARRFALAVQIAEKDVYRAATHNKGIMNGVDAVVIATGNDFRAIEAGVHAYACRDGQYRSLSRVETSGGLFRFSLRMPLTLGTLGGLTRLHPLADASLELLGRPSARELMMLAGAAGLANHFAAIRSLVTSGIQAGHMRMHLPNILRSLGAGDEEKRLASAHFKNKAVSHQAVADFLQSIRKT